MSNLCRKVFVQFFFKQFSLAREIFLQKWFWLFLLRIWLGGQTLLVHSSKMNQKCFESKQRVKDGGVLTFSSSRLFLKVKTLLLDFEVALLKIITTLFLKLCHVVSLYALQFSLKQIYYAISEKTVNFSWLRVNEIFLLLQVKYWNDFMCSLSKDFQCFDRLRIKRFGRMGSLCIQ